jgi:indole-3-glycerol phosphate synthase/phosphoribosylanthranilate isomerase
MLPVGVFRDAPLRSVADIATLLDLHAVQLHGREDEAYVRELRGELPPACEIWTALSVGREPLLGRGGDRLVFDNGDGGTGRTFDWSLVDDHPELSRSIVAGGLGVNNVAAARNLGAYGIDIGSSVDVIPGRKSAQKIEELFDLLRPASRERLAVCA